MNSDEERIQVTAGDHSMKKLSLLLAGLCVAASVSAQAANTNVTSVNMVGFVNQNLIANQFHFSAVQMATVGGTNQSFDTLIGNQLPGGSVVFFWNSTSQAWAKATKAAPAKGGWGIYSNRQVSVGEGIFIHSTSNMTVSFAGEVPLAPTSTVSLVAGYNAIGYMYPVDMPFTNSVLFDGLSSGSILSFWDDTAVAWVKYTKAAPAKGGWGAGGSNLVLRAGQGFFATKSTIATNLFEVRPFTP